MKRPGGMAEAREIVRTSKGMVRLTLTIGRKPIIGMPDERGRIIADRRADQVSAQMASWRNAFPICSISQEEIDE